MLPTFIITILTILSCFTLMSIRAIFKGRGISGSCGNKENPCECSIIDKLKCKINK